MNHDNATELTNRIKVDMRSAMKARDAVKTSALKSLLARFSSEEAVTADPSSTSASETPIAGASVGVGSTEAARKVLSLADGHKIIQDEIDEMQHTIDHLDEPSDYRTDLEQRVLILGGYLR